MPSSILQLSDSANWEEIYSGYHQANVESPSSRFMYTIPEINIPVLLERRILIIYATSSTAKEHWKNAGYLNQKIQSGITIGGTFDTEVGERKRILLNRKTLFMFSDLVSAYSVNIKVHEWIQDIDLGIWQYTGAEADSTEEMLETLKIDVLRAEAKIDILSDLIGG